MGAGLLVPERREEVMEFCRLRDWACGMELGIESWRGRDPRVRSGTTPERALPETLSRVFPVVMLRVEVLDEDRWCLRWEGTGWLGPERRWFALLSDASRNPAEVEEVLETTEAFWAALSKESSRVNRLTWTISIISF